MKRILHTMLRVGDLQRSIEFYTHVMGMKVLRTVDQPDEKYSLTFIGYGEESETSVLELTYNYGVDSYTLGNAYGHIAIGVDDCYIACEEIKSRGGIVSREAGPLLGSSEIIAFVTDPDGYKIELIEKVVQ